MEWIIGGIALLILAHLYNSAPPPVVQAPATSRAMPPLPQTTTATMQVQGSDLQSVIQPAVVPAPMEPPAPVTIVNQPNPGTITPSYLGPPISNDTGSDTGFIPPSYLGPPLQKPGLIFSGVPIPSLGNSGGVMTSAPVIPLGVVTQIPLGSQVLAVFPSQPSDWYFIGPSDTAPGNFYWGNPGLKLKVNVSPNGMMVFGGFPL